MDRSRQLEKDGRRRHVIFQGSEVMLTLKLVPCSGNDYAV